eukprot:1410781-Pyramimonas_sp.AAC.1
MAPKWRGALDYAGGFANLLCKTDGGGPPILSRGGTRAGAAGSGDQEGEDKGNEDQECVDQQGGDQEGDGQE